MMVLAYGWLLIVNESPDDWFSIADESPDDGFYGY
jgi:hypothetical protein